jgi:uncharacterized membrane protein
MHSLVSFAFALAVIASFILVFFAVRSLRKGTMERKKALMMIAVAVITLLNVILMSPVFQARQSEAALSDKLNSAPR